MLFRSLGAAWVGEYILPRRNTFALWSLLGAAALVGLMWLPSERWHDLVLFGLTTAFFYGSNAVVGALLTELYPTSMRTTAFAVCGSAPLSAGFALFPAIVPLVVQSSGWQVTFTLLIAPLLLVSAAAALLLPNVRSGSGLDAERPGRAASAVIGRAVDGLGPDDRAAQGLGARRASDIPAHRAALALDQLPQPLADRLVGERRP